MPSLLEVFAVAAGVLLIIGFFFKGIYPLRLSALMAAVLLAGYGALQGLWWVTGVSVVLAIVNAWRMMQILRLRRSVSAANKRNLRDFSSVHGFGTQVDIAAGSAVFRRGEPVNAFYVIESGRVQLQEVGIDLGPGDILGELGFFTDAEARTATAICVERTRVHMLTEDAFRQLQFQDPSFWHGRDAHRHTPSGRRHGAQPGGLSRPRGPLSRE